MAQNKRHHFVPQFYLRHFSSDESGRAISLLNIPSGRVIHNAPIKGQCYKDRFYGSDNVVEKMLSQLEGAAANLLRRALSAERMTAIDGLDFIAFLAVQSGRTEAAQKHSDAMAKGFFDLMRSGGREGLPADWEEELYRDTVDMNMKIHLLGSSLLFDLKPVIVFNSSGVDFVTSDSPVIEINPAWTKIGGVGGYGLGSAGMIIGMPISPNAYFLAYDARVYTCPGNSGSITTSKIRDISVLNTVVAATALKNIYFRSADDAVSISRYVKESAEERDAPKSVVRE